VSSEYPQVRVVHASDRPRFEVSRARNLGAEAAEAPWLCFIDADVLLTPDFSKSVMALLEPGRYYRPEPRSAELWGTCICQREHFDRIEGYDDVLQGWGAEDSDFYMRLRMAGVRSSSIPGGLLRTVPHDDALRVAHHDVQDAWLNATANRVYCRAKWDLMRQSGRNLPRSLRQRLYEQFYKAVIDAHAKGKPIELGIPLYRENTWSCGPLEARLVYRLPQPRGNTAPNLKMPDASGE
jgi:glycosyltransferase involved in cell wall biosynthesis